MKNYLFKRYFENTLLFLLIISGGALKVGAAYFTGSAFTELIKYNLSDFIYYIELSGIAFLLYLLSLYVKIPFENYVTQKMITDIRLDISNSIIKNNFKTFYKIDTGNYVSWLSNDLMIIEQKGFSNFYQLSTYVIETILAIIGLFSFHWSIILFTLFTSVITLLLPMISQKTIESRSEIYSKSLEKLVSKNTNILQGFDVLLSFNKLNILKNIVTNTSTDVMKTSVSLRKSVATGAVLGGIGNVFSQIGIVALTGFLAMKNSVSLGSILTIEALSSTIFNSVGNIMNISVELKTVNPIFKKFDDFREESNNIYIKNSNNSGFSEEIRSFTVKDLVYSYNDKLIFNNFNYCFSCGNKYAILGKSGSGKSTLFKLLTGRLDDYKGSIKINNIEIKKIKNDDLYKQIIYISQEPYIFTDDIKFNITLGDNFDDLEVNNVINKVGLGELVSSLENGIYTKLEEGGRNLSGGQKQRISLARGLIRNKKILFLDEITSSQDEITSSQIEELVLNNKELTVFMITHKLGKEKYNKFNDIITLE